MTLLDSVPHVPARTPIFRGSRSFDETVQISGFEQTSVAPGSVCMFLLLHTQVAAGPVKVNLDRFAHGVRVPKHVREVNESATSHQH